MNVSPKSKQPMNWVRIGVIAVIVIIAGYQYITQMGNQNAEGNNGNGVALNDGGVSLPDQIDLNLGDGKKADKTKTQGTSQTQAKDYLSDGRRGAKVSPAGLIYTNSRSGEHRTEHVLRHAADQPNRSGSHGVFNVDEDDDVFRLIDEAYGMIKQNSKQVKSEPERDGKKAFVIDMKRTIGYKGGQSGKRSGNPKLSKMKLILADDRVITAYPY